MVDALAEWHVLGRRLQLISPDKFEEVLDRLREAVGVADILGPRQWVVTPEAPRFDSPKA